MPGLEIRGVTPQRRRPIIDGMLALVDLWDAFAAGVYVLFGLVHLDLWRRRRERRGHLWLAGASFSALVVDSTGLLLRHPGSLGPLPLAALNLAGVAAASACLFELSATLGGEAGRRSIRPLELGLVGFAGAAGLPALADLAPIALVLCCGLLVRAFVRAVRAARLGESGAGLVVRGFLVLIACLLADVAMQLGVAPLFEGLPALGFIALFLASAWSLADRRDREERELAALRSELERRVEERTLELQEANRRLAEASRTDALTGLPNRRSFLESGAAELRRSRRSGRPLSIVLADIDHFKRVNDTWGHAAGDAVLQGVARVVRGALREQDLVARWGGEELVLLLGETGAGGAVRAAETVRAAVEACRVDVGGTSIGVTLSLGVAEHAPGASLDGTLAAADRAMYAAKEGGRNRVALAGA